LLFNSWDFRGAEAEALRAIQLNPNSSEPHHLYAYILTALNRPDEAIKEEKRSMEQDPFARSWALGYQYVFERQYDAAIAEFRARGGGGKQDPAFQFGLAWAYEEKGMYPESALELEKAFHISGDERSAEEARLAFKRDGMRGIREWSLKQNLEKIRAKKYVSALDLATDYARLGRKQETLAALEKAYEERSPWLSLLQKSRGFDFVHSDERYRALVKRIGLPPAY
jgi:tetratricopeptide (TPR) repeat protein